MLFLEYQNFKKDDDLKYLELLKKIAYLFRDSADRWEILRMHKSGKEISTFIAKNKKIHVYFVISFNVSGYIRFASENLLTTYSSKFGFEFEEGKESLIPETGKNYAILKNFIDNVINIERDGLLEFLESYKPWFVE